MVGLTNAVFLARLAILPFAALVCVTVWLALRYRAGFSRNQAVRILQATVLGFVLVAIVMIQLWLYRLIAQNPDAALDDYFVTFVQIAQSLVGIVLIFRTLLRGRQKNSSENSV